MTFSLSRRRFIAGLGAFAALAPNAIFDGALAQSNLYLPTDLSYFKEPVTAAAPEIQIGYHAITWGGRDEQAIADISELGFRGIQLRANVVSQYAERPKALRDLLTQNKLSFVALSSGGSGIEPGTEAQEIAKHVRHATFVRDAGGMYLQITDSARPKGRQPVADDFKRLGSLLTEIGKRTADIGIPLGYHNHMDALGESPEEIDKIMESTDPRYVKLLLDIAHYHQGGGNPAAAIKKYKNRLLYLHIKDVASRPPTETRDQRHSYQFVELGQGQVNLPEVLKSLREIKFRGWGIVELDSVPDKSRTPKESAVISKKYLTDRFGMKDSYIKSK